MCIAIPGEIIEFLDGDRLLARVDVLGSPLVVNAALVTAGAGGAQVGDWVLVHAGRAISAIDAEEALATRSALEEAQRLQERALAVRIVLPN